MNEPRPDERENALALLRDQHDFPGPYVFRVVVIPSTAPVLVSAVGAALVDHGSVDRVEEHASRTGKYLAVRLHTEVHTAERVLDVYEVIAGLDGVLMTL